MPQKITDRTLYILEGSARTDCTTDPKKVADMRKSCGPTGKIYVWREGSTLVRPPEYSCTLLSVTGWPARTPDFTGYPGHDIPLD